MARKRKRKRRKLSRALALVRTGGAAMARATAGRARTFVDRKKEAARKACRGKQAPEN